MLCFTATVVAQRIKTVLSPGHYKKEKKKTIYIRISLQSIYLSKKIRMITKL